MAERMQLGPRATGGGTVHNDGGAGGPASLDEVPVISLDEEEIKPEDIPF